MTIDFENQASIPPVIKDKQGVALTDYFCPFCNFKLFRGDVADFNIVCSQCNKLVRSTVAATADPES